MLFRSIPRHLKKFKHLKFWEFQLLYSRTKFLYSYYGYMHSIKNILRYHLMLVLNLSLQAQSPSFNDLAHNHSHELKIPSAKSSSRWIEDQYIDGYGNRNPLLVYKRGKLINAEPLILDVEERHYRSSGVQKEKFIIHPELEQIFLNFAQDPIYGGTQVVLGEDGSIEGLIYIARLPENIELKTKKVTSYEIRTYELLAAPLVLRYSGPFAQVGVFHQKSKESGSVEYLTSLEVTK